jgi:DNA repair ATPase RecN
MGNFAVEKADAEQRLEHLRRQRGIAHLDGAPFDDGEITETEHNIDRLAKADAEATRRERERAALDNEKRRGELLAEMETKETDRLEAVAAAEGAARTLAAALADAKAHAASVCHLATRISEPTPLILIGPEFDNRLSDRLSAVLTTVPGARAKYGHMQLHFGTRKPDDDWVVGERDMIEFYLDKIRN